MSWRSRFADKRRGQNHDALIDAFGTLPIRKSREWYWERLFRNITISARLRIHVKTSFLFTTMNKRCVQTSLCAFLHAQPPVHFTCGFAPPKNADNVVKITIPSFDTFGTKLHNKKSRE